MLKTIFLIFFSFKLLAFDLRPGDILLQELHCRLCTLIEDETNSPYSHIALYLGEDQVAEAFGSVRSLSLKEFIKKSQKKSKVKIMRPSFSTPGIKQLFEAKYQGLSYDDEFLWDNQDTKGDKLYCSELVYLLLSSYSYQLPAPTPMTYNKNIKKWQQYFQGNPPAGNIGISPAHFDSPEFFSTVGFL